MGIETRGGRRYYYRKRRIGGRVVSEYVGGGDVAARLAAAAAHDRERAAHERAEWRTMQDQEAATDQAIDEADQYLRALVDASLLAAGYRTHKGEWRKRRNNRHG